MKACREIFCVSAAVVLLSTAPVYAESLYVVPDILNKRTCPSTSCGIVGQVMRGNKLTVLEKENGFARVTDYYDPCTNGFHDFVKAGDNRCIPANGMKNGKFAEWVSLNHLSSEPSLKVSPANGKDYSLVKGSDDFDKHRDIFLKTTLKLIADGKCSRADFKKYQWWKSTTTYKNRPVYFTYCGAAHVDNRIYLNVSNGKVFK